MWLQTAVFNRVWLLNQRAGESFLDTNISFVYNGDGQIVSKNVNGTTTEYFYNGGILAGQKSGNDVTILYTITIKCKIMFHI